MSSGTAALSPSSVPEAADSAEWSRRMADCLLGEHTLLEQLEGVLLIQREAVGRDDLEALEEGTHAARRVLRTLAEARRRRAALLELGVGDPGVSLDELEARGVHPASDLVQARARLQEMARRVSLTLSLNRTLLGEAARSADRGVRTLLGASPPPLTRGYTESSREGRSLDGGRHLNQQV